jgi:hypothetical protein
VSADIRIGGICEQDLDLFLLEECVSSRPFLAWLLSQVPGWPEDCKELVAAERSATHGNGESDVELTLRDSVGRVGMVLIENKLGAGFQPQQLPRYRERASMYVQQDKCVHASIILFAPRAYTRARDADVDAVVEYEAVEAWLADRQPDERLPYKLQLLATALQKHGLGYNPPLTILHILSGDPGCDPLRACPASAWRFQPFRPSSATPTSVMSG